MQLIGKVQLVQNSHSRSCGEQLKISVKIKATCLADRSKSGLIGVVANLSPVEMIVKILHFRAVLVFKFVVICQIQAPPGFEVHSCTIGQVPTPQYSILAPEHIASGLEIQVTHFPV